MCSIIEFKKSGFFVKEKSLWTMKMFMKIFLLQKKDGKWHIFKSSIEVNYFISNVNLMMS